MLRRLIAPIGPEQTVLPAIGLLGLLEDVGDQLLVGAVRATRDAFARIFVPSIEITPTSTNPASSHSSSTKLNSSAIGRSCRRRNSAIVE